MEVEYELNRAWVYDDGVDEPIGETNFVVPAKWLIDLYNNYFAEKKTCSGHPLYGSFEDFLDVYEPESEGEFVYQKAIEDGVIKEDIEMEPFESARLEEMKSFDEEENMQKKVFTTPDEITKHFIEDGWGKDTSFSELTLEESKEKGYLFAIEGISKGRKYFKMNSCNNIYDDTGKVMCYDLAETHFKNMCESLKTKEKDIHIGR